MVYGPTEHRRNAASGKDSTDKTSNCVGMIIAGRHPKVDGASNNNRNAKLNRLCQTNLHLNASQRPCRSVN